MNNLMKRIMSVAMAAITTTSPILSSYTIYASDITVNDDGTVTQMSTSTDSSMSEADETKFLFIKSSFQQKAFWNWNEKSIHGLR